MNRSEEWVVFRLDDQRYALSLQAVVRVVRTVAITPLPNAPDIVLGIVNVAGTLAPVVDLRCRFSHTRRPQQWSDQIILAHAGSRLVAIPVDAVDRVLTGASVHRNEEEPALAGVPFVRGALRLPDGIVLIHDLEQCLTAEEDQQLARALETAS